MARIAGVSQATVSRVLTGSANVAPERRERVLAALEATGYQPNAWAAAMKTGRTGTVGVVISDVRNPFYPELLSTLGERLAAHGHRMILWESSAAGEESAIAAIDQGLVDGVLLTTSLPGAAAFSAATDRGAPVVLVNRTLPDAGCDQVSSDNEGGAARVGSYFLAAGRTRAGLVRGTPRASTAMEREAGFRRVIDGSGIPLVTHDGDFSHGAGHRAGLALLDRDAPPTAIFCVNDLMAFGVLDAAIALGVRVPEELWVVGFDDIPMAAWETFDLTTVRQPIDDMATHAVEALLARIAGADGEATHQRFGGDLIIRRTTGHHPE